jgi:hypothetical protein
MYNIWQREYEFAIQVKLPTESRTTSHTDWLRENVGHENLDWAYGFVTATLDVIVYQFYFRDEGDLARFKLAML